MWKIGGAKASQGADLDEVIRAAQKAIDNTRSVGIGTAPCTIPAVGHPNFTIEAGMMEVGIGHHGEPGIAVESLKTADEIAKKYDPQDIQKYKVKAGKEFFRQLHASLAKESSFMIESTLSGKYLVNIIKEAKNKAFMVILIYLFLENDVKLVSPLRNIILEKHPTRESVR